MKQMAINLPQNPVFRIGDGSGKAIRNPYPTPEHHQKLINFSDW